MGVRGQPQRSSAYKASKDAKLKVRQPYSLQKTSKKRKAPKTGIESYLDALEAQMQSKGQVSLIPTAVHGPALKQPPTVPNTVPQSTAVPTPAPPGVMPYVPPAGMSMSFPHQPFF